jgi:hypothetical protein
MGLKNMATGEIRGERDECCWSEGSNSGGGRRDIRLLGRSEGLELGQVLMLGTSSSRCSVSQRADR